MRKALVFISYHPGSLTDYIYLAQLHRQISDNIIIFCQHPYLSEEIINSFGNEFNHVFILQDIDYEINILKGFSHYKTFINNVRSKINPFLDNYDAFNVVSDCSAYLPVNALCSELKKLGKFGELISIRRDHSFSLNVDILETLKAWTYCVLLGLHHVYGHKSYSYLYIREPRDKIVCLLNPYENDTQYASENVRFIHKKIAAKDQCKKKIVIVYSDLQLAKFSSLPEIEFKKRSEILFARLSDFYKNCLFICKPHPSNNGQVMHGMEQLRCELYSGGLTSQLHLETIINEVKACYSIMSTSLLYSASLGIPSYTFYKYLECRGEFPDNLFDNDSVKQNKFLHNIKNLDEIGMIDEISTEQTKDISTDNYVPLI